jgi:hypothetical protein
MVGRRRRFLSTTDSGRGCWRKGRKWRAARALVSRSSTSARESSAQQCSHRRLGAARNQPQIRLLPGVARLIAASTRGTAPSAATSPRRRRAQARTMAGIMPGAICRRPRLRRTGGRMYACMGMTMNLFRVLFQQGASCLTFSCTRQRSRYDSRNPPTTSTPWFPNLDRSRIRGLVRVEFDELLEAAPTCQRSMRDSTPALTFSEKVSTTISRHPENFIRCYESNHTPCRPRKTPKSKRQNR